MHRLPVARLEDIEHGRPDAQPHGLAVAVAGVQELVRPQRGLKDGLLAVLVDQELGAAVDFEVGGHRPPTLLHIVASRVVDHNRAKNLRAGTDVTCYRFAVREY